MYLLALHIWTKKQNRLDFLYREYIRSNLMTGSWLQHPNTEMAKRSRSLTCNEFSFSRQGSTSPFSLSLGFSSAPQQTQFESAQLFQHCRFPSLKSVHPLFYANTEIIKKCAS